MCTAALIRRGALTCRKKTKQINYSRKVEHEGTGVINITLDGLLLTFTNVIRMGSKPDKYDTKRWRNMHNYDVIAKIVYAAPPREDWESSNLIPKLTSWAWAMCWRGLLSQLHRDVLHRDDATWSCSVPLESLSLLFFAIIKENVMIWPGGDALYSFKLHLKDGKIN